MTEQELRQKLAKEINFDRVYYKELLPNRLKWLPWFVVYPIAKSVRNRCIKVVLG